jgi:hypothetical protein
MVANAVMTAGMSAAAVRTPVLHISDPQQYVMVP